MQKRMAAMAIACSLVGVLAVAALPATFPDFTAFADQDAVLDDADDSSWVEAAATEGGGADAASAASAQAASRAVDESGLFGIVVNRAPIDSALAKALAAVPQDYCSHIGYIDQYEDLPSGCEIVALSVCLNSMGYAISSGDIAENHMDMSGEGQNTYLGSPYDDGGCLPPAIVQATAACFEGKQPKAQAFDITGTPMNSLIALANQGYPVCVWTTEGMMDPYDFEGLDEGWSWYYPEHCVVLYGANGDNVLVSDSLNGLDECEKQRFAEVYDECGSMAVMVLPEQVVRAGAILARHNSELFR